MFDCGLKTNNSDSAWKRLISINIDPSRNVSKSLQITLKNQLIDCRFRCFVFESFVDLISHRFYGFLEFDLITIDCSPRLWMKLNNSFIWCYRVSGLIAAQICFELRGKIELNCVIVLNDTANWELHYMHGNISK